MNRTSVLHFCILLLFFTVGCGADVGADGNGGHCGKYSYLPVSGVCECISGYSWCDPNDPNNQNCCQVESGCGNAICEPVEIPIHALLIACLGWYAAMVFVMNQRQVDFAPPIVDQQFNAEIISANRAKRATYAHPIVKLLKTLVEMESVTHRKPNKTVLLTVLPLSSVW